MCIVELVKSTLKIKQITFPLTLFVYAVVHQNNNAISFFFIISNIISKNYKLLKANCTAIKRFQMGLGSLILINFEMNYYICA